MMVPPEQSDGQEHPPLHIDERWLMEWFEFGLNEMNQMLSKYAAFDEYRQEHGLE
jgi:hypothetical protein